MYSVIPVIPSDIIIDMQCVFFVLMSAQMCSLCKNDATDMKVTDETTLNNTTCDM